MLGLTARTHDAPDIMFVGFVGGTGGASSFMRELAAGIQARGLRTRLVVPAWEGTIALADSAAQLGVPVERSESLRMERGWRRSILEAAQFIRRHRAPVVHYHLSDDYMEPAFLRAMDLLRPPRAFASMHCPYARPGADAQIRLWARQAPRHFRRVICVSRESRARQIRNGLPPALTTLIYNAVDVARFGSGDASIARRALPGVPADAPLVISTARIEEQKQPLAAVAAFARIASEFADAQLVMVGRGPLEDATRAAADASGFGGRVHLVGHQINVPDWLAAATVWLLPTLGEGFSMAVIEAMAAGCPIVSTRCAGNDEVLVDGENALTVPVGDAEAMAAALRRALADAGLRARLGASARAAAGRYSMDAAVEQHLACYGLASHGAGSPARSCDVA